MKIKHWKPQQKKHNTFFIDALKIVCVVRHHLKIPVKYWAPGHKYIWSWRLANCREDNGSSELMKPVRVCLSNLSPSQLPQWPVYYCNNEAGVNNSLICGHLGPGTHGVTICRRQVRRAGDGGQVPGDSRPQWNVYFLSPQTRIRFLISKIKL